MGGNLQRPGTDSRYDSYKISDIADGDDNVMDGETGDRRTTMTVVGTIEGKTRRPIGEYDYTFPIVTVEGSIKPSKLAIGVADSPKTLACEEVAKNAMCADRFGKRLYPQQGIELSWTHTDGSRKSDSFAPAIPVTYNSESSYC